MFCENTLCSIWVFVCRRVTLLENYRSIKFHEIVRSGSLENRSFPLKQPVTSFWSNAHAWTLIGFSEGFHILDPRAAPSVMPKREELWSREWGFHSKDEKNTKKALLFENSLSFLGDKRKRLHRRGTVILRTKLNFVIYLITGSPSSS